MLGASWSVATALSLLAWYVFAPQCISTLAAVKRETNSWRYPLMMAGYLFALAYIASLHHLPGGAGVRPVADREEPMLQYLIVGLIVAWRPALQRLGPDARGGAPRPARRGWPRWAARSGLGEPGAQRLQAQLAAGRQLAANAAQCKGCASEPRQTHGLRA